MLLLEIRDLLGLAEELLLVRQNLIGLFINLRVQLLGSLLLIHKKPLLLIPRVPYGFLQLLILRLLLLHHLTKLLLQHPNLILTFPACEQLILKIGLQLLFIVMSTN